MIVQFILNVLIKGEYCSTSTTITITLLLLLHHTPAQLLLTTSYQLHRRINSLLCYCVSVHKDQFIAQLQKTGLLCNLWTLECCKSPKALIFTLHAGKLLDIRSCLCAIGGQSTTDYHFNHCAWPTHNAVQLITYYIITGICWLRININMYSVQLQPTNMQPIHKYQWHSLQLLHMVRVPMAFSKQYIALTCGQGQQRICIVKCQLATSLPQCIHY